MKQTLIFIAAIVLIAMTTIFALGGCSNPDTITTPETAIVEVSGKDRQMLNE